MKLSGKADHSWDHDIVTPTLIQAHTLNTSAISTYSSLNSEEKKINHRK